MRTLRRLKFMSSPSLSDLGKREPAAAAADERGTQQRRACANATWNSIHNGVIAVFQRKGLPDQELFSLNEGVRQLLKTELGSFFTEYLQNQLLTKGMVILRDKIRFYEGQKLLDSLAETWDFFFSDVLPTLQAVFYPVQGKEPSVRQLALLHFRNIITLSVKLEDALARARARVPPAVVQMLLVLQQFQTFPKDLSANCCAPSPVAGMAPYSLPACLTVTAPGQPHVTGGARVPGSDQGLPAPRDADPEGGVALPGHLRPLLQRGCLHTLLHPGEALPAPLPIGGHPGQEPGGAVQELQHATAEPRGGARGRGCGGRRHGHPQALGLRDDVLPRAPGLC
uniref:Proline-rich protein 5 isoform X3 n=1 Tax=Tursiops truncatus TaxID=9739 RepID=A0A6J3S4I3_TURTR|nr:proline-rich protein 5 isoform X3 [Tursiops truncatus]